MTHEIPAHYIGVRAAEAGVSILAAEVAASIIESARTSGDDPIAWVAGNQYYPSLRSFSAAEEVWQADFPDGDTMAGVWELFTEEVERLLDRADVCLESPDWDNSLFCVDLRRFTYADNRGDGIADDMCSDWIPVEEG